MDSIEYGPLSMHKDVVTHLILFATGLLLLLWFLLYPTNRSSFSPYYAPFRSFASSNSGHPHVWQAIANLQFEILQSQ